MDFNVKFNVDFDKECRRHGYVGMREFEDSLIRDLYEHKHLEFLNNPSWVMDSLKKYYDIETYLRPTAGNFYSISIDYRKSNFVDDNTISNYFS